MKEGLWGGIEGGGTKFVCLVGTGPKDVREEVVIPTLAPDVTIGDALAFFEDAVARHGPLRGLGIGSFGPVDLRPASPTWGYVTSTPKAGWRNVDLAGPFRRALQVPVAFDTDVNAAALGEWRWGAAAGLETFVYLTVGTGIGGGGFAGGRLLHGLVHPEMGHLRVPRDPLADPFPGCCPFHRDCLEGLASGPALLARWGRAAEALPERHEAWALEARYLALALVNLVCTLSPERFILGGGVMEQAHLFPRVRREVDTLLNGYVRAPEILEGLDGYIVPAALGSRAGALGALALAERGANRPPPTG